MSETNKKLVTGNEAAVLGAIAGGAEIMFGYPITPATEILQNWAAKSLDNSSLSYLQTEDETAAGFCVNGALLAGVKAFTASAGPGHILLQDPISMAEMERLPFVGIMMQRGGPSTGTVNFSQQEVNLASFGGNGDGLRVVYSASSVHEMYTLTTKAFSTAWKFRFPTFVLGDGYLGKTEMLIELPKLLKPVPAYKILKENAAAPTYLRNCYSDEESFGSVLDENIKDWKKSKHAIAESESYKLSGINELIIAHGIVAEACKDAIDKMLTRNKKIGLWRPITLNPIDSASLIAAAKKVRKIHIFESALNQFARIIKYELAGLKLDIIEHGKPARGFTPEEIIEEIMQ
ncbi:MAG: ferredoxin oxidoreductase [Patescibacteria group bacterium]